MPLPPRDRSGRRTALLAALVLGLGPALTACGDEPSSSTGSTIPESEDFNDADVAFAAGMIPHHAQALTMVDLTQGRDLSPEVTALAEEVRAAQTPEIEEMTDLLEDWDQPVPETARDHANAEGHGGTDMDDSGSADMMSAEDMEALEQASDADFEQRWLQMMVEHHEGAVEMAEQEVADGEDADAIALAEQIAEAQRHEIEQMEKLLS